jgi:hypothetical protein
MYVDELGQLRDIRNALNSSLNITSTFQEKAIDDIDLLCFRFGIPGFGNLKRLARLENKGQILIQVHFVVCQMHSRVPHVAIYAQAWKTAKFV